MSQIRDILGNSGRVATLPSNNTIVAAGGFRSLSDAGIDYKVQLKGIAIDEKLQIEPQVLQLLAVFYALTGSDSTSYIAGHTKTCCHLLPSAAWAWS